MPGDITDAAAGAKHDPALALSSDELHVGPATNHEIAPPPVFEGKATVQHEFYTHDDLTDEENQGEYPTEEELHTLRRVAGHIPWKAYTLAFVELCERFSYYGTTVVCMQILL
jgi:POT family proton-dependent oligopeptide transporter